MKKSLSWIVYSGALAPILCFGLQIGTGAARSFIGRFQARKAL